MAVFRKIIFEQLLLLRSGGRSPGADSLAVLVAAISDDPAIHNGVGGAKVENSLVSRAV